jgi:hypothetical protein
MGALADECEARETLRARNVNRPHPWADRRRRPDKESYPVTSSRGDAVQRKQFTATPELRTAVNATIEARETLELFNLLGIDDNTKLAPYKRRLRLREQTEREILQALYHRP